MKLRNVLPLLLITCACVGCKASALNDAGQTEKQKEQGQVDTRSDAIDKMSKSAQSNTGTN